MAATDTGLPSVWLPCVLTAWRRPIAKAGTSNVMISRTKYIPELSRSSDPATMYSQLR